MRTRPEATREGVLSFITDGRPLPPYPFLVGRRGYYANSMGRPGVNDLNVYDDAIFLVEETALTAWNANCDPTRETPGMANLLPGRWSYRPGIHNISKDPVEHPHYEALVQAMPVTVHRFGGKLDTGYFGINIHKGGVNTTSSAGCQTIVPEQWAEVMPAVHRALARVGRDVRGQDTITYILTERAL